MHQFQVGDLLVASSLVEGSILDRGVCLLVFEDDEHAIGLMLNRPMRAVVAGQGDSSPEASSPTSETRRFEVPATVTSTEDKVIAIVNESGDPMAAKLMAGSPLHFGGPIAGPVVAVHGTADLAESQAGDGVFVAAQREHLEKLLARPETAFRLIIGHLGWSQEQLTNEMDEGIWHRIPATAELLATPDAALWARCVRRATANSVARWLGAADAPRAAELN